MRRAGDPDSQLEFLEAVYAWELNEQTWVHGVVQAAAHVWGRPVWACGYEYDASDVTRFRFQNAVFVDASPQVPQLLGQSFGDMPPEAVAGTYRKVTAGFGRDVGGVSPEQAEMLRQIDTVDFFGINGLDPTGLGCFIGIGAERTNLFPHEFGLYERLSSHLAAAYRIRRRLRQQPGDLVHQAEALVRPDGHLVDARGPATEADARAAIQEATRRRERARGHKDLAPTEGWVHRVSGRWTLVDAFESDGQRYIVARENQSTPDGLAQLTEREHKWSPAPPPAARTKRSPTTSVSATPRRECCCRGRIGGWGSGREGSCSSFRASSGYGDSNRKTATKPLAYG